MTSTMTEPKPHTRGTTMTGAILVTGAGGEMGHALLKHLHGQWGGQREIVSIDLRELHGEAAAASTHSYCGSVADAEFVQALASKHDIGEVWHLAALLSSSGERNPELALSVNVMGSCTLLKLAAESARRRGHDVPFMFPSTIAAYGVESLAAKVAAGVVSEDECGDPITMYGLNKRAVEEMGRYYMRHYRLLDSDRGTARVDFRSIRFPGIISADTVPMGGTSDYGPEMLHAAAQGKSYSCFVRPDAQISFMTMPDAVRALVHLAQAPRSRLSRQVYNVTAFAPTAAQIEAKVREFFPRAEITYAPVEARQRIVDSWPMDLDDSAARRDWGWSPVHGFGEAFRDYLVPAVRARYG